MNSEGSLKVLLANKADVHHRDKDGETALFKAVRNGRYKIVERLLNAGAKADITNKANVSPYQEAVKYQQSRIISLLKDKITSSDKKGRKGKKSQPAFTIDDPA